MPRSKKRTRPTTSPCPRAHRGLPVHRQPPFPRTYAIPGRYRCDRDAAVAADRAYFAAHSEQSRYTCPYRPGKFGPLPDNGIVAVLVEQLVPGFRLRLPLTLPDAEPRRGHEEGGAA